MTWPEELTTPLYSLGAKLFAVCAGPGEVSNIVNGALFTLPPSCISASPPKTNLGIFTEGNLLLHCISNLPLGVTNEGREAIKQISGAVAGDSSLQDRGFAHNLLSLLF